MPHFGCYSQVLTVAYSCLLVPTDALVSAQVPASSMLSACYSLGWHYVLRSFAPVMFPNTVRAEEPKDSHLRPKCRYRKQSAWTRTGGILSTNLRQPTRARPTENPRVQARAT